MTLPCVAVAFASTCVRACVRAALLANTGAHRSAFRLLRPLALPSQVPRMPRSACSRPAEKAPGSPYTVGTMLAQPHHVEHQRGRGWTNSCLQIQRAAAPSHPQPLPRFSQDGRSAGAQHADVYSLPGPKPNRQVDLCLEKQAGLRAGPWAAPRRKCERKVWD